MAKLSMIKENNDLPFSLRILIIKMSSIQTKIKLSQCSKEYSQLARKAWNQEFLWLMIKSNKNNIFINNDNGISASLDLHHSLLQKSFIVTHSLRVYSNDIHELIPKMDLSSLIYLGFGNCSIDVNDFKKLLVRSLKTIEMAYLRIVTKIDLIVLVMKKLPMVEKINASWQPEISSIASLIQVEREHKLNSFSIINLPGHYISPTEIERFKTKHIASGGWISLKSDSFVIYSEVV